MDAIFHPHSIYFAHHKALLTILAVRFAFPRFSHMLSLHACHEQFSQWTCACEIVLLLKLVSGVPTIEAVHKCKFYRVYVPCKYKVYRVYVPCIYTHTMESTVK